MPELTAKLLTRALKASALAETHKIAKEGCRVLVRKKQRFQDKPFDNADKEFILNETTRAIQLAAEETKNMKVTFDHRHPRPYSLVLNFRIRKRGEK